MVDVNTTEEQDADRLDEALQYLFQFNYDFMQKVYIRHRITSQDIANQYIDLSQAAGTASILPASNTVVGIETNFTNDFKPGVTQITIGNETRTVDTIQDQLNLTVNTNWTQTLNNAPITVTQASDRVLGVVRVYPIGSQSSRISMFDFRYQFMLNNVWDFASTSYQNYALTREHLETLNLLFVGEIPIRYTKHQNRLFMDMKWDERVNVNDYILIEAWLAIDPDSYSSIYNDIFLKRYLTALIKLQWAQNLSKFGGLPLPGGITVNFGDMKREAFDEIKECREEIRDTYEEPPGMLVG